MSTDRPTTDRRLGRLHDWILAAFQQAQSEGEFELAEHLLRALEVLAACEGAEVGGADCSLAEAYLVVGRTGKDTGRPLPKGFPRATSRRRLALRR